MTQALVVSDNDILNGLYGVNLEVYLATRVTVLDSIDSALKLLELNPHFDIVICLCLIDGKDCALALKNHIVEHRLDIPMIVIGKQSAISVEDCVILPSSYNIKSLVRSAAKILGVTAKDMAALSVPEYFPVNTKVFFNLKHVECDVYYRVRKGAGESEYLLILSNKAKVWPRIRKYLEEGVNTLYIPASDRLKFTNTATEQIISELEDKNKTTEEKIDTVERGIELVAAELLESKVASENVIRLSQACMETMSDVSREMPKIKKLLSALLSNKSGYLYAHSILTSYVADHILRTISWGGESHIEKLRFVLFFHDMFLVPIYNRYPEARGEEDLVFNPQLSDSEKEIVLNHAKMAGEIVQKFPRCPLGADQLIVQHHGTTSGLGFALKYKDDISPLAKVIIVAEHFVEELYRLGEGKNNSFNKTAVINELKQRYAKNSYIKIAETLATLEI